MEKDPNNRFKSWEHCFKVFSAARKADVVDYDYLSLHLAFYLASFGMYRGSSFLLQKDYKVHIPVIKEILNSKYDPLLSITCSELKKEENLALLFELCGLIKKHYEEVKKTIPDIKNDQDVSSILITKVLLGALGCVPAYDRYFKIGIYQERVALTSFEKKSIVSLCSFYEEHIEEFETTRSKMKMSEFEYPQMKIIDLGYWKIGYDKEHEND